jgi:hypothetical protein
LLLRNLKSILKIKFFGNGLIYHSASFSVDWWEQMLKKNKIKHEVFLNNLFIDDLFLQKSIFHPITGLSCCNYTDLLGKPNFIGASVKEHGFMEIKQNNKSIFKGNIETLSLNNLLFPLFNSETKLLKNSVIKGITITTGVFIKGLVGSYTLAIDEFKNENLQFHLIEIDNNKTTGTYIDGINYEGLMMKPQPLDYLISSQRFWCEMY